MLLEVRGLTKHFAGLTAVLDFDQSVKSGEILGLIGPNGAGKTTLFNLISGFLHPSKGKIIFKNKEVTGMKPAQICRLGIARTFQIVKPLGRMTVLENVMVGAFCRTKDPRKVRELATEVLEFTHQSEIMNKKAASLTLGDRKLLEISRALATRPDLLLLDECMAGLNSKEISVAIQLIGKIKEKGITIIVIEHVMKAIMSISDRIVVLNYGEKIMEGNPEEVVNDQQVIKAYLGADFVECRQS
jgi:branched-chain amino acid transport system ATP-binding protein